MKKFMQIGKRILAVALVALSVFAIAMPALAAYAQVTGTATTKVKLNARTSPSTTAALAPVGSYPTGTLLTLMERTDDSTWYRVKNSKGEAGWVMNSSSYLTIHSVSDVSGGGGNVTPPTGTAIDGFCTGSGVYVRSSPHSSPDDNKTGVSLSYNQSVKFIEKLIPSNGSDSNSWFYITSPTIGYVASQYIDKLTQTPPITTLPAGYSSLDSGKVFSETSTARASFVRYKPVFVSTRATTSTLYVKIIAQMSDYYTGAWKRQVEETQWVDVPANGKVDLEPYGLCLNITGLYGTDIITEVRCEVWNFADLQGLGVKIPSPSFN